MYIITGGRKTQSALYRIRYTGEQEANGPNNANGSRPDSAVIEARQRRRELETLVERPPLGADRLDQIWRSIGDADPRIRYAARVALERQRVELWQQRALGEQDRTRALTALSALVRRDDAEGHIRVVRRLNEIDLSDATRTQRHVAAWIYQRCVTADAALGPELAGVVRKRLGELYPDRSYLVNEQLSLALAQLGAQLGTNDFVAETLPLLNRATEQRQQMHYLFVLRNVGGGWTRTGRETYFDILAQSRQYVGGEGMPGFLERIRKEALASVPDEDEQERFAALLAREPAAAEESMAPRSFVRKWTANDALAATQSLDGKPDLERGLAMFTAASCSKCHRVGRVGTLVGPDLTAASSRFGRRDLLESIVEPSKVIAENYRSLEVVTADGKSYVGRVAPGGDFRSQKLRLAIDAQRPFEFIEIDKRTIEQEQVSAVSWMPEGLLDTLSADEIRDLVAFIEAGGQRE
jgi:putative heme-binding domain-containing protein